MSKVWKHFDHADNKEGTCKHCHKNISCEGESMSGLLRHIKSKQSLSLEDEERPFTAKKVKIQQKSIMSFVNIKKESLQTIVSQLAAVDGFLIHAICKSKFIRESISAKGFRLPFAETSIMNLIHCEHKTIQEEIKSKIEAKLQSNTRFSITLDEYTSIHSRKYMNVNIHYENKFINLGLIRMFGSCDAAKMLQLQEKHLADFGITHIQASIVRIVSDNASVMKKLGKLSQVYNQLCYAHGIYLAECDVLYKFGNVAHAPIDDDDGEQEDHAPIDDDKGEQEDEELFDDGLSTAIPAREECPAFTPEIEDVLKKVRKVVKVFQKSTVKNELFKNM